MKLNKMEILKYFLYRDFRRGFYIGQRKAKEYGIYIQKYCGCIYSEEDRYKKQIEKDKNQDNLKKNRGKICHV